jgi:tetratricopeptide (TPR) repeat protein
MKYSSTILVITAFISLTILSCGRNVIPVEISKLKEREFDSTGFERILIEAIKFKLLGNTGEALRYFEQCVRINPESDGAWFQMAQIVMATGNINAGKQYALKAQELQPANFWYLMMLASTYYQEHNLDSTIIFYEKAVKAFPEKEELMLTLGNLYSESKRFDKANEIFNIIDRKNGINEQSTVSAVKNLIWAGRYEEALVKANLLLKINPDEIVYNGLLAEIYQGMKEPEKAMEVYKKLMERNPDNPQIQLSLCDFFINENNFEEIIFLLNTLILNEKISREEKIDLFARLIELPQFINNYGTQLQISIMVLEAAYKGDGIIAILRPELLVAQKRYDEAIQRLEELIKEQPENYYAWEKLLLTYFEKKDFTNLQYRSAECATKFNMSFLAKILYATSAAENKQFEIALEELRKAEILAGNNKDMVQQVLSQRADVFYRMNNFEMAFMTFEEALKINNQDLTTLNNYAYYLAEQNMKLKEAEEMAKKVILKEPKNTTFLDTYAWVLFKRGKTNEALKIMNSIIKSNERQSAEWQEHIGYIYKKKNDCKNALINWQNAIMLDSTKIYLKKEIEKCAGKN